MTDEWNGFRFARHFAPKRDRIKTSLRTACSTFAGQWPIDGWPEWLGRLYGIRVPKSVTPRPFRMPRGGANIKILLRLIESVAHLPGELAECGVFQGATLLAIGLYLQQKKLDKTIYGFDSFRGFDDRVKTDIRLGGEPHATKGIGGFGNTSAAQVSAKVTQLGLDANVRLVEGFFRNSLSSFRDQRFCFVHLDCDIYESYRACLEFFYPRLELGGVILLDEYNDPPWPGCNKAVDEFLTDKPERVSAIESDKQVKFFIRKEVTNSSSRATRSNEWRAR